MKENEHQKEENSKLYISSSISKIAKKQNCFAQKMKNGNVNEFFVAAATLGLNLNLMGPKSTILAQ